MPALIALLVNMLRTMLMAKAGVIVAKILLFFGIGLITHKFAVGPIMDQLQGMITTTPGSGLGATMMQWAGALRFDQALTMILSAYVTMFTIRSTKTMLGVIS